MSNEFTSRRVSWLALALSLLSAGVGHVYCGRIAKALPLYFAWLLVPVCGLIAALWKPSTAGLVLLLLLPTVVVILTYLYAAMDAWRLARQIGPDFSLQDYNRPAVYCLLIFVQLVVSIGLIAGVQHFVYEAFVMPANSMSPTFLAGDRVLAKKLWSRDYFPHRGDLVAFRNPSDKGANTFLGRVVAVSGDELEIRDDQVFVNGKELVRDRVPNEQLRPIGTNPGKVSYEENSGRRYLVAYEDESTIEANDDSKIGASQQEEAGKEVSDELKTTIPDRHVFVLGDNRDLSRDSRHFGAVHAGDLVGTIDYIYWPTATWSRFGIADARLP